MDGQATSAVVRGFERAFCLGAEERAQLERLAAPTLAIAPRRKLIDDGRPCAGIFILKSGWLSEYKQLRDGTRQILNFRLAGDVVGLDCLAYRAALHSTATLTACAVAPVPRALFEEMQRAFPRLASALFLMALRDNAILHEWAVSLGRRTAFSRIAHLLLELSRRVLLRGLADGSAIPFPLNQQDIADCTGLTTPYVNRVLQQMRQRGLVRLGDHRLEILEPVTLARAAGFRADYLQAWAASAGARPPVPFMNGDTPAGLFRDKAAAGGPQPGAADPVSYTHIPAHD
ncbi:MAG: Crp/Fnr family transcriptional regulator, partial [Rhodospirillaceae bacterium]|nr:Crp/Fnr family transcriptional regulator [Rhodospirillaceae bacterium]